MSELQSFMISSALRFILKFTMLAGLSTRAQIDPETTSLASVSSVCFVVRSRRDVNLGRVIRV